MSETIVKLNPAEYGLKEDEVQPIENAFMPKIVEREALKPMYEALITEELTPVLCSKAHDLRLKLVKVRTGIADIHKTQKAYFLAAGRYVDAWKNKETLPVEQMEEKLEAIEKYFENIEKERKRQLRDDRLAELLKYEVDGNLMMLGEMQEQVWINYLAGVKLQFDVRKEAERKAEETRLAEIEAEIEAEKKRQEEIRLENERLKKEAEAAEKARLIAEKKARKEHEALQKKADAERTAQQAELAKAEKARKDAEAKMLAQAKADRERLEAANAEREKAESELRAKREAEERAAKTEQERLQQEEIARQKAAKKLAAAPDKEKLLAFAKMLTEIPMPELKTEDAGIIKHNIIVLIGKIDAYIKEKAEAL